MVRTGFGVALEAQHDLGRSVPPSRNVLGHVPGIFLRVHRETSGQAKIANLELAVGIHKQITRFEIAMEDVRRVDVLQTAQNLVYERLEMGVGQGLAGADDGRQITLHQLCNVISGGSRSIAEAVVPS
jgi:hypothetical protein